MGNKVGFSAGVLNFNHSKICSKNTVVKTWYEYEENHYSCNINFLASYSYSFGRWDSLQGSWCLPYYCCCTDISNHWEIDPLFNSSMLWCHCAPIVIHETIFLTFLPYQFKYTNFLLHYLGFDKMNATIFQTMIVMLSRQVWIGYNLFARNSVTDFPSNFISHREIFGEAHLSVKRPTCHIRWWTSLNP